MGKTFSALWREATDLDPSTLRGAALNWPARPQPYKSYPTARRFALPRADVAVEPCGTLEVALASRRSCRRYSEAPLSPRDLGDLLWACQGLTERQGPFLLRTAPSAGALYPFETYVSVQNVEGISPCLTHLHIPSFELEVVTEGDIGPHLAHAALSQGFLADAAAVFLWTVLPRRSQWKYRDRAYRYLGLDLGHLCQNLYLAAASKGFGCCAVAAFFDGEMNRVLGVDGEEEFVYYLAAVGRLAGGETESA